nr:hypothetical protein [uncultured Albidiferax sp.]
MRSITSYFSAILAAAFLAGCASQPQLPVNLKPEHLSAQSGRVAVAMTEVPKVNTFFPGAGCLLCLAAAEVTNSALTTQTKTLTPEDLPTLKEKAAEILRKKGMDVIVVKENFDGKNLSSYTTQGENIAKLNFLPLAEKYKVEKLLVFSIDTLGFTRAYSAYIPAGDPKAAVHGIAYMVNLKTNQYEWYKTINITKAADGTWYEPPAFPGLTNSYFQAIELSQDEFLKPLSQ